MEWNQSGRKAIWLLPSGRCSGDTDIGWWASWRMIEAPSLSCFILFCCLYRLKGRSASLSRYMCFGLKDFVHFAHACSHFSQNHYFSQTRYGSCRSEARWWQSRARDCVITTQKDLNQGDISELYTGQARACLGCEVVSGVCHVEIVQKEFESQCYYCRMELGVCSHHSSSFPSQL